MQICHDINSHIVAIINRVGPVVKLCESAMSRVASRTYLRQSKARNKSKTDKGFVKKTLVFGTSDLKFITSHLHQTNTAFLNVAQEFYFEVYILDLIEQESYWQKSNSLFSPSSSFPIIPSNWQERPENCLSLPDIPHTVPLTGLSQNIQECFG